MASVYISHKGTVYVPPVLDGVKWVSERKGTPSKLTFQYVDAYVPITEGDVVAFNDGIDKVFFGYVFVIKRNQSDVVTVTAYDQMRYLKNKYTYTYSKTATKFIKQIAGDFDLKCGDLADTKYVIPSRIEDGKTLFDMIQTSLDLTVQNTGNLFIFYDDYGELQLKNLSDMRVPILIDADTAQTYDYSSSIDDQTYNEIKLYYDNTKTGKRDTYIVKDSKNIKQWGILRYYEKLEEGENGKEKAEGLLKLYNNPTKSLSIKGAFGNNRVRAGSMIMVRLNLGDVFINHWMLVESCTHTYNESEHWMDLKVKGGVINA